MAEAGPVSRKAFVIGDPIAHSRSPLIHRYWLEQAGLSGGYDPVRVLPADLPAFLSDLKHGTSGYSGGNVTIPHKEAVLALVDQADDIARQIGAANTLWREKGRLLATNTDSYGFSANLDDRAPGWDAGEIAVVMGAGGASRAIVHALLARGFKTVRIANRTAERAQVLANRFGPRVTGHAIETVKELMRGADLFVNTTSLGMDGGEAPAFDFTAMSDGALVTDIVYVPLRTPILVRAESQGLRTADGLGMLLHQAAPGFERWFGARPEVTPELRQMIIADMEAHA